MKMVAKVAGAALAIGLAWPAVGQSNKIAKIGPWEVAPFFENGKFISCVMARDEDSRTIGGGFNRGNDFFVLALFSRNWKLDVGSSYSVRVAAGAAMQEGRAHAQTGTAVGITLTPSPEFADQLRKAPMLEVFAGGSTLHFPLENAGPALVKLEECYEEHARRPSHSFIATNQVASSDSVAKSQALPSNPFVVGPGTSSVAECNRNAPYPESFTTDDLLYLAADESGISACEAAVRDRPNDPQRLYQLGRAYAAKGETASLSRDLGGTGNPEEAGEAYKKAILLFEAAAQNGSTVAFYDLAQLYSAGSGAPQNSAKAFELFEQAHAKGVIAAAGELGLFFEHGKAPAVQDYARARAYYEIGAEHGDSAAMSLLAKLYQEGKGVPRDREKMALWQRRSEEAAARAEQRAKAQREALAK